MAEPVHDMVDDISDPLTSTPAEELATADETVLELSSSSNGATSVNSDGQMNDERTNRTEEINVDLSVTDTVLIDISDALSERDKIPPAPPRPDFDASREKLQKLGENESTMTKEEFVKAKQELEQEYLATFKKTVAMHEVFLCRLAAHPMFRNDPNFRIFLEYEQDLCVRGKNKKEKVESLWKRLTQSADEVMLSGQKEVDDFFDHERNYLAEYHAHIKEATIKSDRITHLRKRLAESYGKIPLSFEKWASNESCLNLQDFFNSSIDFFEKLRRLESRVATDDELKQSDTLRYYMKDTGAAKDLIYRRMRCLANYELANKNLERARSRNRDITKAEMEQSETCKRFEDISEIAKVELQDLKQRRIAGFKKNLVELADMQIKHTKAQIVLLQQATASFRSLSSN